jgi:hypothetical protein
MGAREKRIGAKGELEVRDVLQEWWRLLEPEVVFARTPLSGGWAHAEQFRAAGDLVVTPGSAFPFCVEVKRRRGWASSTFVAGRPCPVWGWWLQAQAAAAKVGLEPILVFRRPRAPWMVLVRFALCRVVSGAPPPVVSWGHISAEYGEMPVGFWLSDLVKTAPQAWVR